MKFFLALVAVVAVAAAGPLKVKPATNEIAELEAIIAAIQSPNTDPATAALLEEQLQGIVAALTPVIDVGPAIIESSPISVGPAIIETNPISVGPAIIDFPLPDGGVVTAEEPIIDASPVVSPSPVIVGDIPAGATPLVQIIVNVNLNSESSVVAPAPVEAAVVEEEAYVPGPVNVVDNVVAPDVVVAPVQVVDSVVEPVQVVEPVIVTPVQVVDTIPVEPVIVGTPIIPVPAVVLPDNLN